MTAKAPPAPRDQEQPDGAPPQQTGAEVYHARCARFRRERDLLSAEWQRIANRRLMVFLGALLCLLLGGWWRVPLFVLLAAGLFGGYVMLASQHGLVLRARARAEALLRLNEEAAARLARAWERVPLRHRVRAAPDHPYAADLDLFGHASLLHLLDTVQTHLGEETLARWLSAPADPDTIIARQQAVAELAPMRDLRDELALRPAMAAPASRGDPEPFLAWAEGERWLAGQGSLLWSARLSPVLALVFLVLHAMGATPYPAWIVFLLADLVLWRMIGTPARAILDRILARQGAFLHYAELLRLVAETRFEAPELRRVQAELAGGPGGGAPAQMRRLARLAALAVPTTAFWYPLVQLTTLWDIHVLALLERWQRDNGRRVRRWLAALGEVEALAALARLAHDHPDWAFPEVDPAADRLTARALGHPLLPDDTRVPNDVTIGPRGTFLLVTGSNMSGKSTLLRAIGVNVVLAGAGAPVCATALRMPPLALGTSMRVQDSLAQGVSTFMAELWRIKAVVEAAETERRRGQRTFLYLFDEPLQGTNSAERQMATQRIIAHLLRQGAIGAVATHDLSLAETPPLAGSAVPVHFAERIVAGPVGATMTFDYILRPGIATSTNALKLMELVGLNLDTPTTN